MTNKITRKDYFNMIKAALADNADIVAFCDKEIAAIDHKADKARERAAIKAQEPDTLMDAVLAVLTNEPMTNADILAAIADEDVSVNKIAYRANALVKAGKALKTEVTIPATDEHKARKLVAYTLAE